MSKTEISKSQTKFSPKKVKIPKKSTLGTFNNTDSGKGIIECKDTDKMFESLGI